MKNTFVLGCENKRRPLIQHHPTGLTQKSRRAKRDIPKLLILKFFKTLSEAYGLSWRGRQTDRELTD